MERPDKSISQICNRQSERTNMTDSEISTETYRAPAFADFNPEHSTPGATPERLAHLKAHGYVIVNDFVDSPWIPGYL